MGAALAVSAPAARFGVGQAVLLAGGEGRAPIEVTVRDRMPDDTAPVIEGEARPYLVTLDDGPCAGLRLWASEAELTVRRVGRPEGRK